VGPARLISRLSSSPVLLGLVQTSPSPLLVRMAGQSGYDFLFVDEEHGDFSAAAYLETIQAVAATGVLCLARLANHDVPTLHASAAAGADAVIVPHVSTEAQARELARGMRDSPRPASLLVIIESALGVQNAAEIFAVGGVDGAFVGPTDLSTDLGCRKDYSQSIYANALASVERAAAASGKFLGTAVHSGRPFAALAARGYQLIVLDTDAGLVREAMRSQLASIRPHEDLK
jgi:2-keto-3-deoxy-L-rhamnonate aldolase RhmA